MSTQHSPVSVSLAPVLVAERKEESLHIPIMAGKKDVEIKAFIDSGAGGIFIHPRLVIKLQLIQQPLAKQISVYNVNDSPNKMGKITHEVRFDVQMAGEQRRISAWIADIGKEDLILGHSWL